MTAVLTRSFNWFRLAARILFAGWACLIGVIVISYLVTGVGRAFRWDGYLVGGLALVGIGIGAVLTWRHEKVGGVALLVVGLAILAMGYVRPPGGLVGSGLLEAMALTGLPPILTGVLLLMSSLKEQHAGT